MGINPRLTAHQTGRTELLKHTARHLCTKVTMTVNLTVNAFSHFLSGFQIKAVSLFVKLF